MKNCVQKIMKIGKLHKNFIETIVHHKIDTAATV